MIMASILDELLRFFQKKTFQQTLVLYCAQISIVLFGLLIEVFNARYLGPEGFGILSFCLSLFLFISVFLGFGFIQAASRLLAIAKKQDEERRLFGVILLASLFNGILFSLILLASSFIIDDMFGTQVGGILITVSLVSFIYPLYGFIRSLCRGSNRILELSVFLFLTFALYAVILFVLVITSSLDVQNSIFANLAAIFISSTLLFCYLKPSFSKLRMTVSEVMKETRSYGIHTYFGRIIGQSSLQFTGILVTFFLNTTLLGFFTLILNLTKPMTMFSQSLSTVIFKKMAARDKIGAKVLVANLIWLSVAGIGLVLFGQSIISILFSEKFLPATPLILPLVLAAFFSGLTQPFNIFLSAKGLGKYLRNIAIIVSISVLVLNIILINLFGIMGAAIAALVTQIINLITHYLYYRKHLSSSRS